MRRLMIVLAAAVWLSASAAYATCAPPKVEYREQQINGRPVLSSIPVAQRGVVYLFHGSGGSERFAQRRETICALEPLLQRGYAVVASQSGSRGDPARWRVDTAGAGVNPDVDYMLGLHRLLVSRGDIAASTPVYAMGMSNGAAFATVFGISAQAAGLPVVAIANYMGNLPPSALALIPRPADLPPLFLVQAEYDGLVNAQRVSVVARRLQDAGARVEIHTARARPITADDLLGVGGLDAEGARRALVSLHAAGVLDGAGRRAVLLDKARLDRAAVAELGAAMPPELKDREILNALLIGFGGHQMRSDYREAQAAFFEAVRSPD